MKSTFNLLNEIPLVQRLRARDRLPLVARVTMTLDFHSGDYDEAMRWCTAQFAERFTWRTNVAAGSATFGFISFTDAFHFALWAPNASIHA